MAKDNSFIIDEARLLRRLDAMAEIGLLAGKGITRLALSEADKKGRDLLASWMSELGMHVHVDQVGNIIGILSGKTQLSPIMLGSHIDTVINAGRFDGCYGVLAALECVRTIVENRLTTLRPIAITAFTNEEGVRYQPGMLGSAVYANPFLLNETLSTVGVDGSIFGEELTRIGYAGTLACGDIKPYAYLELHIEQGPVLYRENIPLGIVEGVVGISWWDVEINGMANHAGTTPIEMRHDAGLAASRMIQGVRNIAVSVGGEQRATCGSIQFTPNAINVIPGRAKLTVDLRNSYEDSLAEAEKQMKILSRTVESEERVTIHLCRLEKIPAVSFHEGVISAIVQAASEMGISYKRMISGAGHDAQLMVGICPAAMIFVPSVEGISHSPDEFTSPEALTEGASVLLRAMYQLANREEDMESV